MTYQTLSDNELTALASELERDYELLAGNRLSLDLSRGKPAPDQLALSHGLDDVINGDYVASDGTDVRNYGNLRGLPEARDLGAEILGVPATNVIAGGNSSLALMHLVVTTAMRNGLWDDDRRWVTPARVLTPVPGYDRHFTLSQRLGLEMVNIDMTEDGPDLDQAEALTAADPTIKGIWCVPKYSNPTGCTYSADVVERLARLPAIAAADDFLVLWDNAYAVHDLGPDGSELKSIFSAAGKQRTDDHVVQFASTSKITFAGAGVAFVAATETVLAALVDELQYMTIGPDKVNQLRHARFLKHRLRDHMQSHARLLAPKFDIVLDTLARELGDTGVAQWTQPTGGYFVSLDLLPGLATEVVAMAKAVGLTLTPAGATFPYGRDPQDRNVRIAPTFAGIEELKTAMHVLTLCVKLASIRQLATA